MVDAEKRLEMAQMLGVLVEGRLDWSRFYSCKPTASDDPTVIVIWEYVDSCFSDTEGVLNVNNLDDESLDIIIRSILFLNSRIEYEWPVPSVFGLSTILLRMIFVSLILAITLLQTGFFQAGLIVFFVSVCCFLLRHVTSFLNARTRTRLFSASKGDKRYWPFFRADDLFASRGGDPMRQ